MSEINKKVDELLDKFIKNAEEERDLALERYRRQDLMIETAEDFVVQGKNAVDFLKTAAQRSDAILDAVKLIGNIYGQGTNGTTPALSSDDIKRQIKDMVNKKSE